MRTHFMPSSWREGNSTRDAATLSYLSREIRTDSFRTSLLSTSSPPPLTDAIPPPIQASVEALAALATKVTRGEETTEEGSKGWEQVASKAKVVADGLRTGACSRSLDALPSERLRSIRWMIVDLALSLAPVSVRAEELRVTLGETSLLASSGALLRLSVLAGSEALSGRTELLRVVGNMCFDNGTFYSI